MERLYDVAARGDVKALHQLLEKDPFLLERVSYTNPNNTPLHIAATKGNISLVEEILRLSPHLAKELDSQQSSPLHMASAQGHVEVAKKLADAAPNMCLRLDSQGRNPLHLAAIEGHIELLEELLRRAPQAARMKVGRGLTVLHLCVEYGQLEALKVLVKEVPELINAKNDDGDTVLHMAAIEGHVKLLEELSRRAPLAARVKVGRGLTVLHLCVEYGRLEALEVLVKEVPELINAKNDDGDTVLHMAVMGKKLETIKYLLSVGAVEVNALNYEGITPLDVLNLNRSRGDFRDTKEIKRSIKNVGGFATLKKKKKHESCIRPAGHHEVGSSRPYPSWVDNKKSSLMVVASLIATMAFQIGVDPPEGVWKEIKNNTTSLAESQIKLQSTLAASTSGASSSSQYNHYHAGAGGSPPSLDYNNDAPAPSPSVPHPTYSSVQYHRVYYASFFDIPLCVLFYTVNTTAFVASLSIVLLLTSGLPLRRGIFMWILMMITWIAIVAIALCYVIVIRVRAKPSREVNSVALVILFTAAVWLLLTAVLVVTHTVRIIKRLVNKIKEFRRKRKRMRMKSSSSSSTGLPLHMAETKSS